MLEIERAPEFIKQISKIKDELFKLRIKKQVTKIIDNPEAGKPMKNVRKGTREIYIEPFRLSYFYNKQEDKIIFLELYHKDKQ